MRILEEESNGIRTLINRTTVRVRRFEEVKESTRRDLDRVGIMGSNPIRPIRESLDIQGFFCFLFTYHSIEILHDTNLIQIVICFSYQFARSSGKISSLLPSSQFLNTALLIYNSLPAFAT